MGNFVTAVCETLGSLLVQCSLNNLKCKCKVCCVIVTVCCSLKKVTQAAKFVHCTVSTGGGEKVKFMCRDVCFEANNQLCFWKPARVVVLVTALVTHYTTLCVLCHRCCEKPKLVKRTAV